MDTVQNSPARPPPPPPRKKDNLMYSEISSTSSEEGTPTNNLPNFNIIYETTNKNNVNNINQQDTVSSNNEILNSPRKIQVRSHYKSMGNINDRYRNDFDNRMTQSDINCNIRSIQQSMTNLDVSLHSEEIKNLDSLKIPIVGYEVMEERARFTIYKLKVEDDARDQSWLVFRRYTDFVRLYTHLKALRPGAALPLPGKRWFKDNFDPVFLEERVKGLQTFVNAILRELPTHPLVREFFCLDEPPQAFSYQPEVQAVYGALEDSITTLKAQLKQKDATIMHLQKKLRELEATKIDCSCSTKSDNS